MIHLYSTWNHNVRRDTKALVCSCRPHQPCEVADDWAAAHECQPLSSRDHRDTEGCKHLDVDAWCGSPRACWPGRLCLLCAEDPAAPDTAAAMWACVQGGERGNKNRTTTTTTATTGQERRRAWILTASVKTICSARGSDEVPVTQQPELS